MGVSDSVSDDLRSLGREARATVGGGGSSVFQRACNDMTRAPVPKQMAVGAAVGCMAGLTALKVGRLAAAAIGGLLFLIQVKSLITLAVRSFHDI